MRWLLLSFALLLAGCGGYEVKNLAKSDIDLVADEFIDESRRLVRELTVKLYKRNPAELAKNPGMDLEKRLLQLVHNRGELNFAELGGRQETDALELVFDPQFKGDRVFALVVGLGGMLRHAYGYNEELFLFDSLQPEPLWASAHNVEVLAWKLRQNRRPDGSHWLVSSEYQGEIDNLSFERLFGKLIVLQEMMAKIAGDADDRRVTKVVHTAGSVFIPLPI
ncbi:hypothetical protein A3709_00610 [Halioglobus sp. HI00S01]|uniref:hypothetical protein n=1 Tax=Halioglobus sp. HI00S01 TaxID=1822214 RepID=UPI0007C2C687|nr:hypothetical protein [Halioglobus sp. HI00S01]KZX60606.1 hypothetical protein A3709_00610 [Halioglobus sp. HI00S01]